MKRSQLAKDDILFSMAGIFLGKNALVSEDIELSEIRYEGDKISVKGTADAMSSVFSFVDRMEKSKYFKEVKTRYTAKRKDGLKDLTDFEIIALTERPED